MMVQNRGKNVPSNHESILKIFLAELFLSKCHCAELLFILQRCWGIMAGRECRKFTIDVVTDSDLCDDGVKSAVYVKSNRMASGTRPDNGKLKIFN